MYRAYIYAVSGVVILLTALVVTETGQPMLATHPSEQAGKSGARLITPPEHVRLGTIPPEAEIIFHQSDLSGQREGPGAAASPLDHIYVMDRNGDRVTQITFEHPRHYEHVAVSYDQKYVIADDHEPGPVRSGPARLWIFNLEEGTEARLVPGFTAAGDGGINFGPDGYIYFPGSIGPDPRDLGAVDLYKIRFDGTDLQQLTQTPEVQEGDPGLSEDGTLIAFLRHARKDDFDQIWVANADGTNLRLILDKAGPMGVSSVHDPEISPDHKQVVFSRFNKDLAPDFPVPGIQHSHELWSINMDGTGLTRLTRPGPLSIIPNLKDQLVVFTELGKEYKGASLVSLNGVDQIPKRIRRGANAPKWIPPQ
jgi:hypothetical protein